MCSRGFQSFAWSRRRYTVKPPPPPTASFFLHQLPSIYTMLFLWRKLRAWREERRLAEDIKAYELAKRDLVKHRYAKRGQELVLSLGQPQRTMEPLVAVQVYNRHFCPLISRLPEELLLCTRYFLLNDDPVLLCFRKTSSIFFWLLGSQEFYWWQSTCLVGNKVFDVLKDGSVLLRFRQLLQRDGLCNDCMRCNDDRKPQIHDECKFRRNPSKILRNHSKLQSHVCDNFHDSCRFPSDYRDRHREHRRYLGQQELV